MILIVFCNGGAPQKQSKRIKRIKYIDWGKVSKNPIGAILLHSPGHKPWVYSQSTYLEPRRGGTPSDKYSCRKCRSYGALFCFVCVYPGFHIGLCPHFTLGFAGVPCLKALVISLNFDALALILKVRCIHRNKYDVLTNVSRRTYFSEYTHLLSRVHRTYN